MTAAMVPTEDVDSLMLSAYLGPQAFLKLLHIRCRSSTVTEDLCICAFINIKAWAKVKLYLITWNSNEGYSLKL